MLGRDAVVFVRSRGAIGRTRRPIDERASPEFETVHAKRTPAKGRCLVYANNRLSELAHYTIGWFSQIHPIQNKWDNSYPYCERDEELLGQQTGQFLGRF